MTYIDFYKAPYSSNITQLHGCFSLLNFVMMKQIIITGDILYVVVNTQSIIFPSHTTVSM